MKRLVQILLLVLWAVACGGGPDSTRDPAEYARLKVQVEDTALELDVRLEAASDLIGHEGGAAFIVKQHGTAHDGFSGLLLSRLREESPSNAAALATRMLAEAAGEAKLEFAHQLVGLEEHALEPVEDLLAEGADWETRVQALAVLGKLGKTAALPTVRAQLDHPNVWVRIAAAHALSAMDSKEAVPILVAALDDSAPTVVTALLVALGKTGDSRAREACSRMLTHANPRVRAAAVSALGRLGGPGVRESLGRMTEDADEGVRYKAEKALEALSR